MIPKNCIIGNREIIIKLDDQEKLLSIDKTNISIYFYEGYYTIVHHKSKSFGTSQTKFEAYLKLIRSQRFNKWYNLRIAKVIGYEHIKLNQWETMTKKINFQIMKNRQWLNINENFFLLYYNEIKNII